jgi:hypothetical protein
MKAARWIVATPSATATLLAPALWNGFPLIEHDTGGYLARWFEGTLVVSRSTVYGLFAVAGWPLDFWPQVVLQAAATVWVLALVLRSYGFGGRPWTLLALVVALCATTTLPWIAGILLTDIFAGLAVLALHLVVMRADTLGRGERVALVLFVAFCGATHSATFLVLLGLAAVALVAAAFGRRIVAFAGALRAVAAVALAAVMLVSANFAISGEIAWTPGGYSIVFARMVQDGIVTRYLDAHCGEKSFKLCPYRHSFPPTADDFLWAPDSIFDKLGRFNGLDDEMRTIVRGSLVEYPGVQLEAALAAAGKQLISVGTGEGVLAPLPHTYGIITRYMPSVAPAMNAARQQRGELHFAAINAVHVPVALATMALLPLLVVLGLRRRGYRDVALLAATVSLAILGNAVVCGALSNPHDRYGARLAWVPLVVASLALLRRQSVPADAHGRRASHRSRQAAARSANLIRFAQMRHPIW